MSATSVSDRLARLRATVVAFLAPTRLRDWWEFKVPVFLGHQFRDLDADRAAGVGTLAVRIGADRTRQVLRRMLLPGETAAFCVAAALGGAWLALVAFVAFMTTAWMRFHARRRAPREIDADAFGFPFYGTLFPLVGAIPLAIHAPAALALLPLHVVAFPGAWGSSLGGLVGLFGGSRREPASADAPPPSDGSISVVIPAYQGRHTIPACLDSLSRQTGVGPLEVVVVESSGDGTAEIAERDFPGVTVVRARERLSAGAARNRGASLASGRFIIFLDQDCVAPPDWAARLVTHLGRPGVDAVGGSIGIANPKALSGAAVYFIEFLNHFPRRGSPIPHPSFLLGCNAGYRAEVLRAVQFPDRTLGEDVLFTERVRKAGFGVIYDPTITVLHHNRTGWGEFFAYARKMGIAAADYHAALGRPWARPFLRWPVLVFPAALTISPLIAVRLLRAPWRYFALFLVAAPACVLGNLVWAAAFRSRIVELGQSPPASAGR